MSPHLYEFQWLHLLTQHSGRNKQTIGLNGKRSLTFLRKHIMTSNNQDWYGNQELRGDTNPSPTTPKALTEQISLAHGSLHVSLGQYTLDKLSS